MGRLLIVDQWLQNLAGHHAEYDFAVAEAAARVGLGVLVFANARCTIQAAAPFPVLPIFTSARSDPYRPEIAQVYNVAASPPAWPFLADLKAALMRAGATTNDQLFIHSIEFNELEDLLTLLVTRPLDQLPFMHILIRRDPREIAGTPRHAKTVRLLRQFDRLQLVGEKVAFYTDTDLLSETMTALSGITFTTLPVPFRVELIRPRERARPLSIVYLGDARAEKGYVLLPAIVRTFYSDERRRNSVRFTIQSNTNIPGGEMGIVQARNQLETYPHSICTVLSEPLSTERYYEILSSADIVLIPYDADRYALRSSGICYQALAAGCVVIVPEGSQMATILGQGEGVVASEGRPFVESVLYAVQHFEALSDTATRRTSYWADVCSADRLIAALNHAFERRAAAAAPAPLVLLICEALPFWERSGCGFVFERQFLYLMDAGYRVGVVGIIGNALDQTQDTSHACDRFARAIEEHGLEVGFSWIASLPHRRHEIWNTLAGELSRSDALIVPDSLRDFIAANAVSVTLLNYITRLPFVRKLGLGDVPLLCETHDIQSFQFALARDAALDPEEVEYEIALLAQADALISISKLETDFIQERLPNIPITTIPPVRVATPLGWRHLAGPKNLGELVSAAGSTLDFVDYNAIWRTHSVDQLYRLFEEHTIDLLFVGADTVANLRALRWLIEEVIDKHLPNEVSLLVAGSIVQQKHLLERDRVYWSGTVRDLKPLYAATKVVVLPMKEGAGANVKVLEALNYKKAIVATSFALRGLETVSSIAGIDDAAAFAGRIRTLLANDDFRYAAAEAAFATATEARRASDTARLMMESLGAVLGDRALPAKIAPEESPELACIEWRQEVRLVNDVISDYLEQAAELPDKVRMLRDHANAQGATDRLFEEIVEALFHRRSAPILIGGPARFDRIEQAALQVTPQTAIHRILVAAASTDFFGVIAANLRTAQRRIEPSGCIILTVGNDAAANTLGTRLRALVEGSGAGPVSLRASTDAIDGPFAMSNNDIPVQLVALLGHPTTGSPDSVLSVVEALSHGATTLISRNLATIAGVADYAENRSGTGDISEPDIVSFAHHHGLARFERTGVRAALDHLMFALGISERLRVDAPASDHAAVLGDA